MAGVAQDTVAGLMNHALEPDQQVAILRDFGVYRSNVMARLLIKFDGVVVFLGAILPWRIL
eukprot:10665404-Prorocentrum_lima.AAC.1